MKVLVTAGATREPLDAVRFLSNVSTGTTGATLAAILAERGHDVTLLRGTGATACPAKLSEEVTFAATADLRAKLKHRLSTGAYEAVIMCAAVSDYRPAFDAPGKLSSDPETLTLQLVRNEKILPSLKTFSPRPLRVIGFKLTVGADEQTTRAAIAKQFAAGGVDAVVHNDLSEIRSAAEHPFRLYRRPEQGEPLTGVPALAAGLLALLRETQG